MKVITFDLKSVFGWTKKFVEAQLLLCGFVTNGTNLNEDISLRSYEVLIDIIEAEIQSVRGVKTLCTSIFLPEGVFFYEAGSCLVTSLPSIFICLKSSPVNLAIVFKWQFILETKELCYRWWYRVKPSVIAISSVPGYCAAIVRFNGKVRRKSKLKNENCNMGFSIYLISQIRYQSSLIIDHHLCDFRKYLVLH